MKRNLFIFIVFVMFFCVAQAQDNVADSIDALHYDLRLDIGNRTEKTITGSAAVTLRTLRAVDTLRLELCPSVVDSVWVDGHGVAFVYDALCRLVSVPYDGGVDDTVTLTVFYNKGQHVMPQGWGGFYFDDNIYYNLGIAIYEYPHNVGKAWFPCRDNFYDKATYHFEITAKPGWKAICTGLLDTVTYNADGSSRWCWTLSRRTPTYLVGVAVAPFHIIERQYEGESSVYPAMLGFLNHDSTSVWRTYENMSKVIPMYERRFGPYRWDRVGYVSTPMGSMEHVGNIAFTTNCMSSNDEACLATMSHEFAHSWFGNLVTCSTSQDMWINEGGASFCEEVAIEAMTADTAPLYYRQFARRNLIDVLMNTHVKDHGFKPVYGQEPLYTYGSTVYDKGATVWHSLRGYMGDSLFYASLRTLFERAAFTNIDSRQLCDSLSLYSGMDLTDFFDFHVFRPGFVDYVIDSISTPRSVTAVYLRQKLYGTDTFATGNRVWVTFFSPKLDTVRRLVTFDGITAKAAFRLPFKPLFAIANYDEELSTASVAQHENINAKGTYEFADALFRTSVTLMPGGDSAWLHVTHHWTRPDTSYSPRYLRMADRYWTVTGRIPDGARLNGQFYYSRIDDDASLDGDFVTTVNDFDKVRLLYRRDAGEEWTPVTRKHSGEGYQGYFVLTSLKVGEYTLAMVDDDAVGIDAARPSHAAVRVCPNPSNGMVTVRTARDGEPLTIEVVSTDGKSVVDKYKAVSGEGMMLRLPSGVYIFRIFDSEGTLKGSEKVQIMNF